MATVRRERPGESARVREIHMAAFGRAAEADLVDALRSSAWPRLSLVAEIDGRAVGHVFFSPLSIEDATATPPFAALGPIGVVPASQGRGIGSALVRSGLDRCAELGWKAVFLIGNPAYYRRFGFERATPLGFHHRNEQWDPVLQVREVEPGALVAWTGTVRYHPAFAETGAE